MFSLKKRQLIRGCKEHKQAGLGCGADYMAHYVNLYAPKNGIGSTFYGPQGGNWYRLRLEDGTRIEFAHLSKYLKLGKVKEGDLIAITGNTGSVTTGSHLHVQIFKNNKRLDPEKYLWDNVDMDCKEEVRKLNTELGRVTPERDTAIRERDALAKELTKERMGHVETLDKLRTCEKEREELFKYRSTVEDISDLVCLHE